MANEWDDAQEKVRQAMFRLSLARSRMHPDTQQVFEVVKDLGEAVEALSAVTYTTTQNLIERLAELHNRLAKVEAQIRK